MRLQAKYVIPASVVIGAGSLLFILSTTTRYTATGDPTSASQFEHTGQEAVGASNAEQTAEEVVQTRLRQVKVACKREGSWEHGTSAADINPDLFSHLFYDDKHKLLYCEVPKVACTNWKRILLILTGKMNTSNPEDLTSALVHGSYQEKYLKKLSDLSSKEIAFRLKTYYKFMFVREPLERILSAYMNKFRMSYSVVYQKRFGPRIVKRYRDNPTKEALAKGHDVTFDEFVKFLVDPATRRPLDPHWRPFNTLCRSCFVHYDFIGKYETMDQDVEAILDTVGVRHLLHFPERPKMTKTADLLSQAYANISSSDIGKLFQLYEFDYKVFGYSKKHILASLQQPQQQTLP